MPVSDASRRAPSRRRRACRLILALAAVAGVPGGAAGTGEPWAELAGAAALHRQGVTGRGVTVAVVAAGGPGPQVPPAADGHPRLLAFYDAVVAAGREAPAAAGPATAGSRPQASLRAMLSGRRDVAGRFEGVAPNADLVLVRALGAGGAGRAADVVHAVEWVVAQRERYGIRVLHLPLAAPARPRSWQDPVRRAVLEAWEAGIVVVAPAGNGGPAPATVAAPGSVPQILTVGALGPDGQAVAAYSAAGPTLDGVVKPELLAPAGATEPGADPAGGAAGGEIRRLAAGTGVSSAVVAGVVALVLEAHPGLAPDEVKARLLASAGPVPAGGGGLAALLRRGAGRVDALAAVADRLSEGGDRRRVPVTEGAPRGLIWQDGAERGLIWQDGALWGLIWQDRNLLGLIWQDPALRGLLPQEGGLYGLIWQDGALRVVRWPDRAHRGLIWSD